MKKTFVVLSCENFAEINEVVLFTYNKQLADSLSVRLNKMAHYKTYCVQDLKTNANYKSDYVQDLNLNPKKIAYVHSDFYYCDYQEIKVSDFYESNKKSLNQLERIMLKLKKADPNVNYTIKEGTVKNSLTKDEISDMLRSVSYICADDDKVSPFSVERALHRKQYAMNKGVYFKNVDLYDRYKGHCLPIT